jgi:protein tyrosine phosphatase (PTP) superfamily phosphohydrolase (DUF442 family)
MPNRSFLILPALLAAFAFAAACGSTDGDALDVATGGASAAEVTYDDHGDPEGLHRFIKWSDRILQGAQPDGEIAFRNLRAMGVTTVISVDGARPDLENAKKYGIRYVHVPIGYHGLSREQQLQIVKAVQISEGPTFVHCHHGKHRGPAGSMTARMALEGISAEEAVEGLRKSECSPKYAGLYRDVENFVLPTEAELAAVSADLPDYVSPPALVDAMIDVDFRKDNLTQSRDAGWKTPPDNPDVSPAHEARMLWEQYREMARLDESKKLGERFIALLGESEKAGIDLEKALRAEDQDGAERAWVDVKGGCNDCHVDYRNNQ